MSATSRILTVLLLVALATAAPPPYRTSPGLQPDRLVDWGVHALGGLSEIAHVERLVGRRATLISTYASWGSENGAFDAVGATQIADRGATPIITWEPWGPPWGTDLPQYSLASIVRGDHDAYIQRFATDVASYGRPVMLRFAHEMNGDWYPWSEAVNGNRAGEYVEAWRHVHRAVAAAGADNVTWIWSANVAYPGSLDMPGLYPGDALVDWVALDGYNFGAFGEWASFADTFGPSIGQLSAITPSKPLMVAEVASAEDGGSKGRWIEEMFAFIRRTPRIDAVVWFNEDKGADWRIQSSPASVEAFRAGITVPLYKGRVVP